MTMTTRVQPSIYGYDGINISTKDGIPLGDIRVIKASATSVELEINAPSLKIIPKAIDPDDDAHNPFQED